MDNVAASGYKKRRWEEPESREPSANRDGSSGADDKSLDLMSRLPDEILGSIISLLPTKGAVRTALVSSRWHHIWLSAPLNFVDNHDIAGLESNSIAIISKILAAHHGPARRLSLCNILLLCDVYAKLDGWFLSPALDGLEELEFTYSYDRNHYWPPRPPRLLPPSALRFAPTLRIACIGCCDFPEISATVALLFPHLKWLKLYEVTISEVAFHRLLAGCTMLDSLPLDRIHGLSSVRIVSPTLRTIGVSVSHDDYQAGLVFQELTIEDARLERLIPSIVHGAPRTIIVLAVPKLTVLGCLSSKISKFVFGTIIIKEMVPISFTASIRTVKVLVLQSIGPNLDAIIGFLRCFPCTQKLYIQSCCRKDMKNERQYDILDPIECLELHLRAVVMDNYEGKEADLNFANFFVLNAKVLKVMKFCAYDKSTYSGKWIADQPGMLQLDRRASSDARFYFTRDRCCGFGHSKHPHHDMSIADPFASALRRDM